MIKKWELYIGLLYPRATSNFPTTIVKLTLKFDFYKYTTSKVKVNIPKKSTFEHWFSHLVTLVTILSLKTLYKDNQRNINIYKKNIIWIRLSTSKKVLWRIVFLLGTWFWSCNHTMKALRTSYNSIITLFNNRKCFLEF